MHFAQVDAKNDGIITRNEWSAAVAAQPAESATESVKPVASVRPIVDAEQLQRWAALAAGVPVLPPEASSQKQPQPASALDTRIAEINRQAREARESAAQAAAAFHTAETPQRTPAQPVSELFGAASPAGVSQTEHRETNSVHEWSGGTPTDWSASESGFARLPLVLNGRDVPA